MAPYVDIELRLYQNCELLLRLQPKSYRVRVVDVGIYQFTSIISNCRYSPLCIDAATVMLGIAEGRSAVFKILGSAEQQASSAAQTKEKAKLAVQSAQKSEPVIAKTSKN